MSGDSLTVYVSCFSSFLVCVCVRARASTCWKTIYSGSRRHAVCCVLLTCWVSSYVSPSGSSIPSPWPSMASCPYSSGCRRTERERRSGVTQVFVHVNSSTAATLQSLGFMYTNAKYFCLSNITFQDLSKWQKLNCVSEHSRVQENTLISDSQLRRFEKDSPPL